LIDLLANNQKHARKFSYKKNLVPANVRRGEEIFAMMQSREFAPDSVALAQMLMVYTEARYIKRAEKFFNSMETTYGIKPNSTMYAAMIKMYCNTKQIDQCFEKFLEMKQKAVTPGYKVYGWLIQACGRVLKSLCHS
jgi:pentatricopeptide repeat protein